MSSRIYLIYLRTTLSLCISVLLFLSACISEKPDTTIDSDFNITNDVKAPSTSSINTSVNITAQIIAGRDSTYFKTKEIGQDSLFFVQYRQNSTQKIKEITEARLVKVEKWNHNNLLRNGVIEKGFVFYPFSGGDFIHAYHMYPKATEYLMVAREPVGSLFHPTEMDDSDAVAYLSEIDNALRDIYSKSYFITLNMLRDISGKKRINGMLPLIIWASAVTGHEVLSTQFFIVDSTGSLIPHQDSSLQGKPNLVSIEIKAKDSDIKRKITYLSCDISNEGFEKNRGCMNYLESIIPSGSKTFIKSASYLMHSSSFSVIRDLIMDKSKYIIQDDTGIPFKYFNQYWNVQLFGVYTRPVKDFKGGGFQSDLQKAYSDSNYFRGPLDFSLGYHWYDNKQNQMVAVKRQ